MLQGRTFTFRCHCISTRTGAGVSKEMDLPILCSYRAIQSGQEFPEQVICCLCFLTGFVDAQKTRNSQTLRFLELPDHDQPELFSSAGIAAKENGNPLHALCTSLAHLPLKPQTSPSCTSIKILALSALKMIASSHSPIDKGRPTI